MPQKQSVRIILFTELPEKGFVALLQKRGSYNFEEMKDETRPGGSQPTAHGGVEPGETILQALNREIFEELRNAWMEKDTPNQIVELYRLETPEKLVVTYGVKIQPEATKKIRLEPSSGGLIPITEAELKSIKDLDSFDKKLGVPENHTIAVFPDNIEALRKGFEKFRPIS